MAVLGTIDAHFWLTRSVALASGVNLGEALAAGALSADAYARMVTKCREAGCADQCAAWLAAAPDARDGPPPFCAHACQLRALRRT